MSLTISRDYKMAARELLPPGGQRCKLTMDSMGQLASFVTTDNVSMQFTYLGNSGLIESKENNAGQTFLYEYDDYGRMTSIVQPTGERVNIASDHSAGLRSLCCCKCFTNKRIMLASQQDTRSGQVRSVLSSDQFFLSFYNPILWSSAFFKTNALHVFCSPYSKKHCYG